ncbi:photosystem II oxygen evolving complex protein PsbQ [Coccomyxa subellipsoidea C-169]|uniref:Photosystem II oxygen evolving complex protein PsbQ n=1 Tax=Coccomyxa subellipsoidea (strain C-169) TaxID=574566 RepID=I0Z5D2_COCSC|nr:photosystem II oxygen evolving complex protein PsbQ [Coccomyxa subellipsoidea C-169]EIE25851.1 photosystem II oxygen evolving complex protein PsbQ [Coccomyxa subellipsoidea C-169]|eukprot:XP_005650395.1 photosystem II oxygen evolving complex protein PsbQ [Coccomyxa subellipsoidea C-169]
MWCVRQVLAGFLGFAGLALTASANAIDIQDERKVRERGFDLIYEARELDLPQAVRDGLVQARASIPETKKRIQESEKRIDTSLDGFVKKQYWTNAREELRLQAGTLRFDLNTLIAQKDKISRKAAEALKKDFLLKVDELDYAIRKKDSSKANILLADVQKSLDTAIAGIAA